MGKCLQVNEPPSLWSNLHASYVYMKFLLIYLFWPVLDSLCCTQAISSCVEQGLLLLVVCVLTVVASLVTEREALVRVSFSSCSTWAQWLQFSDSRVQAQKLWCTSLVATQHAGSSQPKYRTPVSCIGWQILCHWAPGEAGDSHSLKTLKVCLVCT